MTLIMDLRKSVTISNAQIADLLEETAELLELSSENPFRIRAYLKAARSVRAHPEPLTDYLKDPSHSLTDLAGVGSDLEEKIYAIMNNGSFPLLEKLRTQIPGSMRELLQIRGLGAKKVSRLHHELNIKNIDDLRRAATNQILKKLKGFGEKSVSNILSSIELLQKKRGRLLISEASVLADALQRHLRDATDLEKLAIAGSFRRRKETIGDLDVLAVSKNSQAVMDELASFSGVATIEARGATRMTVRLTDGFQIDLRIIPEKSWGAALLYFTGSKDHNIELRRQALEHGLKINEYGVFKGDLQVGGKTEKDVYKSVGLPWIPPELREMKNEFRLAADNRLPSLVEQTDIMGDLHVHTLATDGQNSIEEMAEAALKKGYKYLAFTDHSKRVTVAHGLGSRDIHKYWESIDELNQRIENITLLKGIEIDILDDGSLDLPDALLKNADWVIAAVHYNMQQPQAVMTKRLMKAIKNPYVSALAHPTGRLIGTRESYKADYLSLFKAASDYGCLLEINGQPTRLDLSEQFLEAAIKSKAKFVLNSDAHSVSELGFMQYAVDQARRGGLEPNQIINTKPWPKRVRPMEK